MNKYFSSFAENEVSLLQSFKSDLDCRQPLFSQAVCIPFFDEDLTLLSSLQSAAQCYAKTENPLPRLLILCINRGDNSEPCNKNEAAIAFIQTLTTRWKNQTLSLHDYSDNLTILLIDRNSVPLIPIKQGVGLARKIAGDIAAYFIDEAVIESKFFFSSDADVIFPDNYFSEFIRSANQSQEMNSCYVLSYQHIAGSNQAINDATVYYEKSLRAYEQGLQLAGSSYAYQTIGSCLAIHAQAYIQVRGFPKRSAGEDFYLLNKLNKLSPVKSLNSPMLSIQSRISNRVPFGTGPAVEKLLEGKTALFYPKPCYELLRQWLGYLSRLAAIESSQHLNEALEDIKLNYPHELFALFEQLNTRKHAQQFLQQYKRFEQRQKAYRDWFDGFKTLKAIHLFTETYPKCALNQLNKET